MRARVLRVSTQAGASAAIEIGAVAAVSVACMGGGGGGTWEMATVAMTATAAAIGAMRKKRNIREVFVYFIGRPRLKTR
jgi:hypothetical protein